MSDVKKFAADVAKLETQHNGFNAALQGLLVRAAEFAFSDAQNVEPLTQLVVKGVEFRFKGIDNQVLINWIEKHCPARWVKKDAKFKFAKGFEGEFDAEALAAAPWWKKAKKPTQVASSIDYLDMVRGLLKRMEAEAAVMIEVEENGAKVTKAREVQHAELLQKIAAIANEAEYAK